MAKGTKEKEKETERAKGKGDNEERRATSKTVQKVTQCNNRKAKHANLRKEKKPAHVTGTHTYKERAALLPDRESCTI